jgi:PKD repeat protein
MKKLMLLLLAVPLLAALAACSAGAPESAPRSTITVAPGTTITAAPPAAQSGSLFGGSKEAPPPVVVTQVPAPTTATMTTQVPSYSSDITVPEERMVIRTANLQLVVSDIAAAIERITGLASTYNGYVVSSNSWQDQGRMMGNISFRVEAKSFDAAIAALHDLADDVRSESTSGQDVTEEYVDLTAQLTNLQAAEAQLLKLMEQAGDVSDILAVQQELVKTRGQIEQTKGRMQYLEQSSAMSLIQVNLEQSKLSVEFTANTRNSKEGDKIYFNSNISGGFGPYTYEWDFGDGQTSTDGNPVHSYKSDGTYTVSLKVTDDHGSTESSVRNDYITVLPGWAAGNTVSSAWHGLVVLSHGFVNFLIWLVFLIPLWIVILIILYFAWWRRRRKTSGGA